jgi:hypothetical protein
VPTWLRQRCNLLCLLAALVAGCGGRHPVANLPPDAQLMYEKQGGVVFIAPQQGTLYVVDRDAEKVVITVAMRFGEKLWFSPEKGKVYLGQYNGTLVKDGGLEPGHVYQYYLVKG